MKTNKNQRITGSGIILLDLSAEEIKKREKKIKEWKNYKYMPIRHYN